jgi:hypothetical protein
MAVMLRGRHRENLLTAWPIRGGRGVCGGWLSGRPVRGGRLAGFWIELAHPGQPPVVIDAVDEVSVQLKLADDCGWEVNPAGVKVGKSDGRVVGVA